MASKKINVPEAKAAMDQFKMEAASEVGVNLSNGYNGDLTSRQAGSVGGQMVKVKGRMRNLFLPYKKLKTKRRTRTANGHFEQITYYYRLNI